MKLLRRVKRVESGRGSLTLAEVGIAWSAYDVELDRRLAAGEYCAVDVVEEPVGPGAVTWRCSERVSTDPGDMGFLRNSKGEIIGRVTARERSLVTVERAGRSAEGGR